MNKDPQLNTFTRKGSSWFIFLVAAGLWFFVSVWAWNQSGFSLADLKENQINKIQTGAQRRFIGNKELARLQEQTQDLEQLKAEELERAEKQARALADAEVEKQARVLTELEAAEQVRLSELAAEEEHSRAEQEQREANELLRIGELIRVDAEPAVRASLAELARVEQQARAKQKQFEAEELARVEEQARAVVQTEAQNREQAKLPAQAAQAAQAAQEQAGLEDSLLAEAEAQNLARLDELARVEAQAKAMELARKEEQVNAAQELARTARVAALDTNTESISAQTVSDVPVSAKTAAEASRIAVFARRQRAYEALRDEEMKALLGLSIRLRFGLRSDSISLDVERALDRMFEPLALYSEVPVTVAVSSNEFAGVANDNILSRDRGRELISYLISRGLEKDRFRIRIEAGEGLPYGTHRVRVSSEEVGQ